MKSDNELNHDILDLENRLKNTNDMKLLYQEQNECFQEYLKELNIKINNNELKHEYLINSLNNKNTRKLELSNKKYESIIDKLNQENQ